MELILIIILSIFFWITSIYWLLKWEKFWQFFLINLLVLISYITLITNFDFFGVDPYGLNRFFLLIFSITFHVLVVFIFAFFKKKKLN